MESSLPFPEGVILLGSTFGIQKHEKPNKGTGLKDFMARAFPYFMLQFCIGNAEYIFKGLIRNTHNSF
jgi:hypothetical protein